MVGVGLDRAGGGGVCCVVSETGESHTVGREGGFDELGARYLRGVGREGGV